MSTFIAGFPELPPVSRSWPAPMDLPVDPPRFDLYAAIHKALRCFMGDTLVQLGRMDPEDPLAVHRTLDQVEQLFAFCRQHVAHENEFVHPAIEAACAGDSRQIAREHVGHLAEIAALTVQTATLRARPTPAAAHRLYRELARFIGENLLHMDTEEVEHNGTLWAAYDDAELAMIHGRLVAAIPADEMAIGLRWMQAALSPAELAAMQG